MYVAPCFIEPVSFAPTREGWLSSSAGDDWILVRWRDPDEPFLVWVGIVAARSSDAPSVVINEIGFISGIDPVSEVVEITVADLPGLRIDVEGAEEAVARNIACTTGSAITFLADEPGHPIASTSYNKGRIGVGACQRAAIWVVEVGDRSITIIGGTEDPARHEEAVVKIEELFGFMSFGIGGGS